MIDRFSQLLFLQWVLFLIISLAYDHFAWADQQNSGYSLIIKSAQYDNEKQELKVKVALQGERPYQVELIDAGRGSQLASETTRKGMLKFKLKNIQEDSIPCVVEVRLHSLVQSLEVENSPEICSDSQYVSAPNDVLSEVAIDDVKYEGFTLSVTGSFKGVYPNSLKLYDDLTEVLLSDDNQSNEVNHFSFRESELAELPCRIRVQADSFSSFKQVQHTLDNCFERLTAIVPLFAENDHVLYRNGLDKHLELGCDSCHGRGSDASANVATIQLQGHAGTISECITCHQVDSFPNGTLQGPHGMHPVNEPSWIDAEGHGKFAGDISEGDRCATCHGADHLGTRLAKVPVKRVLKNSEGELLAVVSAGTEIACDLCHGLAKSFVD